MAPGVFVTDDVDYLFSRDGTPGELVMIKGWSRSRGGGRKRLPYFEVRFPD